MCARIVISLMLLVGILSAVASAQVVSAASAVVPQFVNFSGVLTDLNGQPLTGVTGVTFSLYKEETGGAALWLETQNVQPDKTGHYKVMLGSTASTGLPADIFVAGQARWLGVQAQGQSEQPRIMLLSVPYALKAGDAATVGGLPPSAFILANPNTGASSSSTGATASAAPPAGAVTGSGTVNFVPLWDSTSDVISSVIFQAGTGSTAKIGVNTTTPTSTLDVKGGSTIRGTLSLPATGAATATAGKNSQPLSLAASSFNSGTSTAVNQTFQWKAEPAANNTSTSSGTLNLLFGQGTSVPAETGLKVANNGQITFALGQTFPGTGTGTITGVTAGTDLTGGGISGNVTLNIDTTKVPQLHTANTFTGNQTVNGNLSATQLISTAAQGTAPFSVSSSTLVPGLNASLLGGLSAAAFQPAGLYATLGANTFSGTQAVSSGDVAVGSGDLDLPQTTAPSVGVIKLGGSPFIHACCAASQGNTFVGSNAGNLTTTGGGNTAVGFSALDDDTTGNNNTAMGWTALNLNNGSNNTAYGTSVLNSNTSGGGNTASGTAALQFNTTGSNNAALGYFAGSANKTGSNNTFVGYNAGPDSNSTALTNAAAIGSNAVVSENNALVLGGTGANAVAVGIGTATPAAALDVHGTGNFTGLVTFAAGQTFPGTITGITAGPGLSGGGNGGNVSLGLASNACAAGSALSALPFTCTPFATLGANTLSGNQSVTGNVTASGTVSGGLVNAATGFSLGGALFASASNQNTFLGLSAGNSGGTGCCNTATGAAAFSSNTTGMGNVGDGEGALAFNTTGSQNTASGYSALFLNVTGNNNTATGFAALGNNTSGGANTATGFEALYSNTTGINNTATGDYALAHNTTGGQNTADGIAALSADTTGGWNTATGVYALAANTTGNGNIAFGWEALEDNTTGSNNTAVGNLSLLLNGAGSNNTALGNYAGLTTNNTVTTGSNNTFVGSSANPGTQTGLSNVSAIGANAQVTANNAMVLGSVNGVNGAAASTNVGIGTTAPTYLLHIGNSGGASYNNFLRVEGPATPSTGGLAASFGGYGAFEIDAVGKPGGRFVVTEIGRVGIGAQSPLATYSLTIGQGTGHAIADSWDQYSSRRWKTNIQTLQGALAKVQKLRGVSYDLKDSGKHQVGVIAEEVGAVVPEIVSWEKNGKDAYGVDYSRLTALLIEATKEQQALIRKQQGQIKAQQAQIEAQETQSRLQQTQIARLGLQVKAIRASLKLSGRTEREVRPVKTQVSLQPTGGGQ
jgi:hypothetical protein